jgi:hypothetical protein
MCTRLLQLGVKVKNQNILEKTPQMISAFVAFSLILSVSKDYFMFKFLGVSISQLPMTLEDHIKSSVDIYATLATSSIFVWLFSIFKGTYKRNEEIETPSLTEYLNVRARFNKTFYTCLALCVFYFIIGVTSDSASDCFYFYCFSTLFLYFSVVHLFFIRIIFKYHPYDQYIIWLPVLLVGAALSGVYTAISIKEGSGVKLQYEEAGQNHNYFLIKSTTDNFFMWDYDKSEVVLKNREGIDNIRLFKH